MSANIKLRKQYLKSKYVYEMSVGQLLHECLCKNNLWTNVGVSSVLNLSYIKYTLIKP